MEYNLSGLNFLIYIYFSWVLKDMQPRTQLNSARIRGDISTQSAKGNGGYRGSTGSVFSNRSIVEMIEMAARKAPTEV
jgi:hypothetical protein